MIPAQLLTALAHTPRAQECCRWSEVAVTIQLAGQLRTGPTGIVLVATLPSPPAAERFARMLREADPRAQVYLAPPAPARPADPLAGWTVIARRVGWLARRSGVLPGDRDPLLGLPTRVLHGPRCCAAAAWRAALLATPNPATRKPETGLVVRCPNPVLAVALAGLARRLGARAQTHPGAGPDRADHVTLAGPAAIEAVLHAAAGPDAVAAWRTHQPRPAPRRRAPSFSTANTARSRRAAEQATAQIADAFTTLGPDDIPAPLRAAGQLRLDHPQLSLAQLAALADPPTTKDALAGRLRRIIAIAARRRPTAATPRRAG